MNLSRYVAIKNWLVIWNYVKKIGPALLIYYEILDIINGYHINSELTPNLFAVPNLLNFFGKESQALNQEISNFLNKGTIEEAEHCPGEYISNIFTRDKKNGDFRIILNLKELNKHIAKIHTFQNEFLWKNWRACYTRLLYGWYSFQLKIHISLFLLHLTTGNIFVFSGKGNCIRNYWNCFVACHMVYLQHQEFSPK